MQTLSQSISWYLEMSEYERNLSADTLKAYRIDLQQFAEFTREEWAGRDLLNEYIKHLNANFAPRSVKRKLASVRAFYHELEYSGILEENPFHRLHIRISEIYLCKSKQISLTKAGKEYGNLVLQDKTGTIDAKIWDLSSPGVGDFEAMDYICVDWELKNWIRKDV